MATRSHPDRPAAYCLLEVQVRECYGRVTYAHKTQHKCADILVKCDTKIKWTQIILSAITTGGFLVPLLTSCPGAVYLGPILSGSLLAVNLYAKNYNLLEIAEKHHKAGADLWLVRERYLSLLTDIRIATESPDKIAKRRDKLLVELHDVYSGAPITNNRAYNQAREALRKMEAMTLSDDEIDCTLPVELRKGNVCTASGSK